MSEGRGEWAEDLAYRHLSRHGLLPLARNYRCRRGEIDLIFLDGEEHVFVEVRQRRREGFGSGAESVGRSKQARIAATAAHYLQRHVEHELPACRFDVISICGDLRDSRIDWIKDAFQT